MRVDKINIKINNHGLVLRNPEEDDAQMLLEFLKTTCAETRFLAKEPEEITMTLEDERDFIKSQNKSERNLMLLGFLDGEYVGNCSLMGMSPSRYQHRVSMGIALYQRFTGMGIGKVMTEQLINISKGKGIEQIELEVVADNDRAISLYKKMGFEIMGTFPNNMKYKDGTYADTYWMIKKL